MSAPDLLLPAAILVAAALYSSVGHGGASAYLAAMALAGVAPDQMKPAALTMNILVAAIASVRYIRRGCFSWRVLWPFAVTAVPLAFVGGAVQLPGHWYKTLVGVMLLFAAWRLFASAARGDEGVVRPVRVPAALGTGAGIGLLAGLTGTGGGIFLSPLLLFLRWSHMRQVSGVAAVFILANSASGLAGQLSRVRAMPPAIAVWCIAAALGGVIGTELGSRRLPVPVLRRLLAAVLVVAGLKLLLA
jgi:hypothetical protein